jgi:hypothetical protein
LTSVYSYSLLTGTQVRAWLASSDGRLASKAPNPNTI